MVDNNVLAPKLRFKGFNNDWKAYKLKEVIKSSSSNLKINDLKENTGTYALYGATGIIEYINFYEKEDYYIAIVKDGAGVGKRYLCNPKTSIVSTMQYLTPKTDFNIIFLYYLLNTIQFKKYIVGSTIPHIYFKDYSKETVYIPTLKEQEKIANFILTMDNKVNLIKNQLNQTEEYKKSIIQNMFIY